MTHTPTIFGEENILAPTQIHIFLKKALMSYGVNKGKFLKDNHDFYSTIVSWDKRIGGLDNNYMDFERGFSNTIYLHSKN